MSTSGREKESERYSEIIRRFENHLRLVGILGGTVSSTMKKRSIHSAAQDLAAVTPPDVVLGRHIQLDLAMGLRRIENPIDPTEPIQVIYIKHQLSTQVRGTTLETALALQLRQGDAKNDTTSPKSTNKVVGRVISPTRANGMSPLPRIDLDVVTP